MLNLHFCRNGVDPFVNGPGQGNLSKGNDNWSGAAQSNFNPLGISKIYNIKTYETFNSCLSKRKDFIAISNHFVFL